MNPIFDNLHLHFLVNDYRWRIDGELKVPTAEDIEAAVERAKELLDGIDGGTLTVGHLIIAKMDADKDVYDIYVHQGTLGE